MKKHIGKKLYVKAKFFLNSCYIQPILFQFKFLVNVNGAAGQKKGSKIVRSVVMAMISPNVLGKCTWTGKSNDKHFEKFAFSRLKNCIRMIYSVVRAYDKTYSQSTCDEDLKYKILKYAYSRNEEPPQPQS